MGNKNIFKALSSTTRIQIIKALIKRETHLSELARELKVSVPVLSRHVKILEAVGLLKKRIVGNAHLLSVDLTGIEEVLQPFIEENEVKIQKKESLFDAIQQLPGIEIKKIDKKQYITSINGEKGYFIYEVNGVSPRVPIDQYTPTKNVVLELKKLVPVNKKKIKIILTAEKKKKKK
jgi:DNA-binding transcriptional ArsR family regulator